MAGLQSAQVALSAILPSSAPAVPAARVTSRHSALVRVTHWITMVRCEEGWSYIAEWIGVPVSHVLDVVGIQPQARYVVYFSIEPDWWESMDMADAMHPQTFLTYGMDGDDLPLGNGGPLRMRLPRQLGYKSVKFITHMTVADILQGFGKGLSSAAPESGYAWYAGI